MQARIGITRNVVVQPTTYGTDNRCMLQGLAALGVQDLAHGLNIQDGKIVHPAVAAAFPDLPSLTR